LDRKHLVKIVSFITIVALGIGGVWVAQSYSQDPFSEILGKHSFETASEREEVRTLFDADFPTAKRIITEDPSFLPEKYRLKPSEANKMGNPYKVYLLANDFVDRYQKDHCLASSLNDQYLWEVPILDNLNRIISTSTAWLYNDKWEIAATGLNIPPEMVQFSANNEAIAQYLATNGLKNLREIKHIRIHRAFMDALYLVSEDGCEYIVPMSNRPDLVGLENQKIYPVEQVMKVIAEQFPPVKTKEGFILVN